jgi:3-methyladenine DNA glycosylase Tag
MELVIYTKEQHDEIVHRLDLLNENLKKKNTPPTERFLDNSEFLSMMNISKRTAQTWRDEGKVSFSQIGNKIYYLLSDAEALLKEHYVKAYAKRK